MTFYVSSALAAVCAVLGGYLLGRWHARMRRENARGGYIRPPAAVVDDWLFPQAPRIYDQEAEDALHRRIDQTANDVALLGWEAVAQAETQKVARP